MNLGAGRTTAAEIPLLPPKDRNDSGPGRNDSGHSHLDTAFDSPETFTGNQPDLRRYREVQQLPLSRE